MIYSLVINKAQRPLYIHYKEEQRYINYPNTKKNVALFLRNSPYQRGNQQEYIQHNYRHFLAKELKSDKKRDKKVQKDKPAKFL